MVGGCWFVGDVCVFLKPLSDPAPVLSALVSPMRDTGAAQVAPRRRVIAHADTRHDERDSALGPRGDTYEAGAPAGRGAYLVDAPSQKSFRMVERQQARAAMRRGAGGTGTLGLTDWIFRYVRQKGGGQRRGGYQLSINPTPSPTLTNIIY